MSGRRDGGCTGHANSDSITFSQRAWQTVMRSPRYILISVVVAAAALVVASPDPQQTVFGDNTTSWHRFVRAPSARTVKPLRIHEKSGNVSNAGSLLGVSDSDEPTVLTREGDEIPLVVIDFGLNVVGLLEIEFAGSTSRDQGAYVRALGNNSDARPGLRLAFSETLQYLSDRSDFTRSDNAGDQKLTSGTDQIAVRQGPYTWTNQLGCEHDNKVCADGLHGFRYVKIYLDALESDTPHTTSLGAISIKSVRLQYSGYLGTPETFAGNFECSDPNITQWWYDAVYTNDMCTDEFRANDTEPRDAASPTLLGKLVLHDGPKRDRDPYVGDLAVAALTSYLSHRVPEAARNVLEDLAIHQRDDGFIPPASINNYGLPLFDYPLWWVVCTCEHVLYTGNVAFLESFYQHLVKTLDGFYPGFTNQTTSLIERPSSGYGDFAFIARTGPVTYYNALYVHALQSAAIMAEVLQQPGDASRWRQRASTVSSALIQRNWDAQSGAFFDGGSCDSYAICPVHAQDGNSLAILAGVASNSTGTVSPESILDYMTSSMTRGYGNAFYDNSMVAPDADFSNRVYAFISYFELAARFSTWSSPDIVESAFEELRRLYGWMATHDPTVTFWEGIGKDGKPYEDSFTSMAHGWSTGIVPLMVNYVLGVTPTKPGFKEWNIRPVTGDLEWAKGEVPTPDGKIIVHWQVNSGGQYGRFWMQVDSPENSEGTVTIAVEDEANFLSVNGNVVLDRSGRIAGAGVQQKDSFVHVQVPGGRHVFVVE